MTGKRAKVGRGGGKPKPKQGAKGRRAPTAKAGELAAGLLPLPPAAPASPALTSDAQSYQSHRKAMGERQREKAKAGQDIGELPPIVNPERRAAGEKSFQCFCESYFPHTFTLEWSEDHREIIADTERAVRTGDLQGVAMPRGSGKTSLFEVACIWAELYGLIEYVMLIGADEPAAESSLESIKTELETNDLLLEDFPEVCYPIQCLEGIHQRKLRYQSKRIYLDFTGKRIVLPTIPGSKAADAVIGVAGITGNLRGRKYKRHDGRVSRPQLVLLDDPQTDESARSASQVTERMRILNGAVLGLAGPGKKIAALAAITVVCADDLADRMLDRQKNPQWHGKRKKMVYAFPSNEKLWEEYAKIREDEQRADGHGAKATEFYRLHRAEMDAGAVVAWPARFNSEELSAIQSAMNLKFRDEAAFLAEYQNEPQRARAAGQDVAPVTASQIMAKASGIRRAAVPAWASRLTAFVDVHKQALYWVVAGWKDDSTGAVIDYGTWPDQQRAYFTLADIRRTMGALHLATTEEGTIRAGLDRLAGELLGRDWMREDGVPMKIERAMVDSGYKKDVVYEFCRRSPFAAILLPSKGLGIGAGRKPMDEYSRKRGERIGYHWMLQRGAAIRFTLIDTNFWKSRVQDRLRLAIGDPGGLSLFGVPSDHRLVADHLTAESCVETEGYGRRVQEWTLRPGRDNHWFDGVIGCMVAAAMGGMRTDPTDSPKLRRSAPRRRMTVSYID